MTQSTSVGVTLAMVAALLVGVVSATVVATAPPAHAVPTASHHWTA